MTYEPKFVKDERVGLLTRQEAVEDHQYWEECSEDEPADLHLYLLECIIALYDRLDRVTDYVEELEQFVHPGEVESARRTWLDPGDLDE